MFCVVVNVTVNANFDANIGVNVTVNVCFRVDIRMFIPGIPVHGNVRDSQTEFPIQFAKLVNLCDICPLC